MNFLGETWLKKRKCYGSNFRTNKNLKVAFLKAFQIIPRTEIIMFSANKHLLGSIRARWIYFPRIRDSKQPIYRTNTTPFTTLWQRCKVINSRKPMVTEKERFETIVFPKGTKTKQSEIDTVSNFSTEGSKSVSLFNQLSMRERKIGTVDSYQKYNIAIFRMN